MCCLTLRSTVSWGVIAIHILERSLTSARDWIVYSTVLPRGRAVSYTVKLHIRGGFRIKCTGQNIFNMNHFRNSAISELFLGLLRANSDVLLKAVHPSLKGSSKPVFGSWFRLPHLSSPAESGLSSFHKNWTLDDNMGLFRLKIGWDIAKVFLR
jgi:hypothetical protein